MVDYAEDHIEGADVNIDIWEKIAFFAQTEEQQKDFMLTDQIREEIAEEEGTEGGDDYREEQKEREGDFNPYAEEMKEKEQVKKNYIRCQKISQPMPERSPRSNNHSLYCCSQSYLKP